MSYIAIHIPSGKQVTVYRHRERKTYVDLKDYRTEYPIDEIQLS